MGVRVTSEDPNFALVENGASAVDRVFIGIKGAHLAKRVFADYVRSHEVSGVVTRVPILAER
jgi:hypothetical protein